jgi:transcriptional regulator with XRE-family HTH domain
MHISPEQCRAARGFLDWSQKELSQRAGVARKTIADFEQGLISPHARTLRDIVAALEAGGIELIEPVEGVSGPGVRLKWAALASNDASASAKQG